MAVSATPKKSEKMTMGRISLVLIASKIDAGTRCETKSLRLKAAVSTPLAAVAGGIGEVEADAGLKQVHQDQAERQRNQAGEDEPAERADADAAERGDVAHVRDARDERREDERRDDHLDQAQEQRGDDAEIVGDRLQPLGRRRRAVVDRIIDRPPGDDPEHQRDQDEPGQFLGHSSPLRPHCEERSDEASSAVKLAQLRSRCRAASQASHADASLVTPCSDVLQFGREILHDEARALDALADSLDGPFEEAVRLILDCSGKLIVSGLGKSGHVARKIAATFASTGTTATFLHLAEAIHGDLGMASAGRCRDPHFAERRDGRARAGHRPFPSRRDPGHRDHRQWRIDARRSRRGGAGASALARGRARIGRADDLDDHDARARRRAGDDGHAAEGVHPERFRAASSRAARSARG